MAKLYSLVMPNSRICCNYKIEYNHKKKLIIRGTLEAFSIAVLLYVYIPALVLNRTYQWTYPSKFYIEYCTVLKSINMICTMCQNIEYIVKLVTACHILYIYYLIESVIQLNNNSESERKLIIYFETMYLLTSLYMNKLILNNREQIHIYFHYIKYNIIYIEPPVQQDFPTRTMSILPITQSTQTDSQPNNTEIVTHKSKISLKGDIITCAICLIDFEDSHTMITPCGHKFHLLCYNQLKSSNHTKCPICQTNLHI